MALAGSKSAATYGESRWSKVATIGKGKNLHKTPEEVVEKVVEHALSQLI